MKDKSLKTNIILLFSVCIALVLILEIFLRLYGNLYVVKIKGNEIVLSKKVKTWTIHNDIDALSGKLDKVITVRRNAIGFRGAPPPKDFSEHLTIMAVGGSTTYNAKISEGKTWIDVLGRKLKSKFNNLWINNAGFNGQSTVSHIILMRDHIIKLKPKVILFLVGKNDSVSFAELGIDKGFLSRKTDELKEQREDHLAKLEEKRKKDESKISHKILNKIQPSITRIANKSDVVSLLLNIYRNYTAHKRKLGLLNENNLELAETIDISEKDKEFIRQKMKSKKLKEHLLGYEARLNSLVRLSQSNNIKPVFITQPALYGNAIDDVKKINWGDWKIRDDLILNGELYWQWEEMINDVTRKVAADNNLMLIDLAVILPKSSRLFIDAIHYSNEGNKMIANIIYHSLCDYLSQKFTEYKLNECDVFNDI